MKVNETGGLPMALDRELHECVECSKFFVRSETRGLCSLISSLLGDHRTE